MKEIYAFEGLCNRLNGLVSAMLKWDEFSLRWVVNAHCPISFQALFEDLPGVDVTDKPGDWQDYQYCDDEDRHCYYFLRTASDRQSVRRAYQRLIDSFRTELNPLTPPPRSVAIHYRHFIKWEKSSIEHTVEAAEWLANRAAAEAIIVAGDCAESTNLIANELRSIGRFQVESLPGSQRRDDFDRTSEDVLQFCREFQTITACRWAYSNAPSSTVLDASRALGNEVWTSGNVKKARVDNGCHLFSRCGFDLLTC